ncbi:hypothetical protein H1C71_032254 [Ictidomys tridecemlineatus]|nr:hypothetical protein H1C71_032254 [Ictidomys tridecemlineatus]
MLSTSEPQPMCTAQQGDSDELSAWQGVLMPGTALHLGNDWPREKGRAVIRDVLVVGGLRGLQIRYETEVSKTTPIAPPKCSPAGGQHCRRQCDFDRHVLVVTFPHPRPASRKPQLQRPPLSQEHFLEFDLYGSHLGDEGSLWGSALGELSTLPPLHRLQTTAHNKLPAEITRCRLP